MKHPRTESGFTLIELIVVISILAILAGALIPRVTDRMASERDARRLADIIRVQSAIDQYYVDKGVYPPAKQNAACGGWDVSHDGDLIPELVEKGYLTDAPRDPINDETHHYRYFVYDQGSFGCRGETSFYVLGIRAFETSDFAAKNGGFFKCSARDWSDDFAYVTGGGANWKK